MPKLCVFAVRLYLCEKLIASESTDGLSTIDRFWSYLPSCHKYVLISVLRDISILKLSTFNGDFNICDEKMLEEWRLSTWSANAKSCTCTGLSMSQTQKYPLALAYHLLWTSSEDVACQYRVLSVRPHSSAHTGDSSTQRPILPSRSSIRSFAWWGLETSSWSSSHSLDRSTLKRHWICSCQPLETGHSAGPWWSDATARAGPGYVMTTTSGDFGDIFTE